jgi:hypothetical protein
LSNYIKGGGSVDISLVYFVGRLFSGSVASNRLGMITTDLIYNISIWLLPVLIAITFHEAAHGYVARFLGDDTASRLGRVSLNPVRHIDPFGTIILPALLLLARSPFLFGYAKPVPVNFRALHPPRIGMVLVAAAGPAMNIGLAIVAALAFPLIVYLPAVAAQWAALNLKNALIINVVLAVFNLFPLPLAALSRGPLRPRLRAASISRSTSFSAVVAGPLSFTQQIYQITRSNSH